MFKFSAIGLLLSAVLLTQFVSAQANVNESLETISYWVDANVGSDSNPGTQALPFKTIGYAASQAVANNQGGKGTHVWINDGTYRESISLTGSSSDTTLPITLEATHHGKAIVSGSILYTGWTAYSGNKNIYTSAWNNNWGVCATVTGCDPGTYPQPNIMLRQEMVAVNGAILTEVLSVGQMQTGTFYVDTTNHLIYVWPPAKTNMSTASVEVATEPTLLSLAGKSNFVVRGIVFQYANSCRSNPAVSVTGTYSYYPTNILFDSDTFQWNNGQALAIDNPTTYFTVENSSALHNGDSGFQSYETQYGLWQNDLAAYNNWRGAQGAYYACNVAGFHPWAAHNDTLTTFTTQYNQSYGIHWDDDNVSISGSGLIASENLLSGVFAEKDPGPISISNSYVCNQTSPISGAGVGVRNSESVSLTNDVIYNNNASQISVIGQAGGIEVSDWLNGQTYNLITQGLVNTNNIIEGTASNQLLFSDASLNGSDWTTFLSGFISNTNTWWNPDNSTGEFVVPVPNLSTFESLGGWQTTTLEDLNSTFKQPSGSPQNACAVLADANDYWLIANANTVTMDNAGQAAFTFTVMPLLNFKGTVKFTVDGVSEVAGLSASAISSVNISGTATLTITGTTATPIGTYPITVIGTSGNQTRTVTVNLVVPSTSVHLSTDSISFPSQQINTTSDGQSFTIKNNGKSSLSMTSIIASSNYSISSNNCGSSLGAGKTCTVSVTFTPPIPNTINGSVTINDSDTTSPQTVSLTGTGLTPPTATLSTHNLQFGSVLVGSSSTSQSFTLTNNGQSTLTLSGTNAIAITGTDPGDYSQTNNCGTSVVSNASCTIIVTFKPKASGSRPADITFTDNATNSPQSVSLSGSGAYPAVTVNPGTLKFGTVEIGYSSSQMTSTVTNVGKVNLTITQLALSGQHPGEYTETNDCIGTFVPNAACTITVTFKPTATGTQGASITITDNTSSGSNTLTLTGSGGTPTATLSPSNDNFGSIAVGSKSSPIVSTLTNTSSSDLLTVSSITITGTNAAEFSQTNTCPIGKTLAAGKTCTISVTFKPSATGSRSATVTECDNTSKGSHTITLSGTGK
ncbi:MAG TPA: choice-of-anchor D domain-containing protein [Candidatus Sulfotelmatobacter sp.]|nr:choice-of-anchor D domain-containing protein [Candidatus Sulfotelmatobacter sp.]